MKNKNQSAGKSTEDTGKFLWSDKGFRGVDDSLNAWEVEDMLERQMYNLNYGWSEISKIVGVFKQDIAPQDWSNALDYTLRQAKRWTHDATIYGGMDNLCAEIVQVYGRPTAQP